MPCVPLQAAASGQESSVAAVAAGSRRFGCCAIRMTQPIRSWAQQAFLHALTSFCAQSWAHGA